MQSEFVIQETQLNNIFPFYIRINKELEITSVGKSLKKINSSIIGRHFFDLFKVTRPFVENESFATLKSLQKQLVVIDSIIDGATNFSIRGQIESLKTGHELLFIGSPWFDSIENVNNAGLNLHDFAHHDTLTDMLHLLKTQEITNQDLKHLLETINKQKNELKEANKVIHDIALFPQQSPDPIIRISFNGEVIQNNPAAAKLDFIEFEGKLYRNDHFFKLLTSKIDFTQKRLEFFGSYEGIDYSFICIPMNEEKYINIYGRDITEQKIIEQKIETQKKFYEEILNNLPADIVVFDKEHRYVYLNPVAVGNPETRDWLIGKTDYDYVKEKNKPKILADNRREVFNSIIQSKELKSWEEEVNMPDGKTKFILRNMYPVQDVDGVIDMVIGYGIDITERIIAEKQLIEAKKVTDELAESKQNFLANMSHEIRTPLNAILGMAGQLQKTSLSKDQIFFLEIIRSASDNLLVIINDILDLSKMEAGKLSIENIGFEPESVISRAMQVMKHKAEEKGLALGSKKCDAKLSKILKGDPYRLNQILLNLISNAVKFTEKGSIEVECKVLKDSKSSQLVRLSVKDTGIGMDEKFADKLFQKFSQEDESVTRKYGGTGLGMSITKELVELMGGKVYVESVKEKGTTVHFEIEFEKGTDEDIIQKQDKVDNVSILEGKTILVADDNKMNRVVAGAILKNYNCTIIYAENGLEAVDIISNQSPDLVLMDVQMPKMDGLQATEIIRKSTSKTLPIIALTALAIKGDKEKCKQAGMNDYLSKPFEETDLINMMCRWLNKSKVKSIKAEPKKSKNTDKLYSLSGLENIARGDRSFIAEMVQIFIEQSHLSIEQINEAFAKTDLESIKKIAHRLKPAIDSLDIQILKSLIRELELESEKLHSDNILSEKIELLESTLSIVIDQLNLEFSL